MRVLNLALVAFITLGPAAYSEAAPQQEVAKLINQVALNSTIAGVAVMNPGDSVNCVFGSMFFDPNTTSGAILYASLLSAKTSGRPVTISYDRTGTTCTLTQVNVL